MASISLKLLGPNTRVIPENTAKMALNLLHIEAAATHYCSRTFQASEDYLALHNECSVAR